MGVREKVGVLDNQSGKSQGSLIHISGMNPENGEICYQHISHFTLLYIGI